jgi:hypothetical protein
MPMLVLVIDLIAKLMPLTTDSWYLPVNTKKKDSNFHIFALPNTNAMS